MICLKKSRFWLCTLAASAFAVLMPHAYSQVNSNTATVTLTATLGASVTVAVTQSSVNFALQAGQVASGSTPLNVTTTWVLGTQTSVKLVGYFASSTAALTDGTNNIPTSEVLGQVNSGSYSPFTETSAVLGPSGAALTLFTQSITTTNLSANRQDTLNLEIDLSSQPQLPASTYTGTLTLQAQAI